MSVASELIAGGLAGAVGIVVTQPMDTVRIRLQSTPSSLGSSGGAPPYTGILQCLRSTVQQEGTRGLFKGIAAPTLTVGIMNAVLFFSFENASRFLASRRGLRENDELPLRDVALAGCVAGFTTAFISSPSEFVKCLAQANRKSVGAVGEEWAIFRRRIRDYGWLGSHGPTRGLLATIARDVPSFGFYFCIYEAICRRFGKSTAVSFHAGGIAGVTAWAAVYPMDFVKTRWQTEVPGTYKSLRHCLRVSVAQEGGAVLFKGCAATLLRAWPQNAVLFTTYEFVKRYLP